MFVGWFDGYLVQFDLIDVVLGLYEFGENGVDGDNFIVYLNFFNGNFFIIGFNFGLNGKVMIEVVNIIG